MKAIVNVQPHCPVCRWQLLVPSQQALSLEPDKPVIVRCNCGEDVEATFWVTQK